MTLSKKRYKVENWPEYNQSLVNRGKITLWFSQDYLDEWYESEHSGHGAPRVYSDVAIQCLLMIKGVFKLPLRALQGLAESLAQWMKLPVKIPHYSTICRRQQTLGVMLHASQSTEARDIAVDSTGLKVYGQGEWHARKHDVIQRRTWRKLHLAIDVNSQEVVGSILTTNNVGDTEVFDDLVNQVDGDIHKLAGDGAYDAKDVYKTLEKRKAEALIPPRKGAKIQRHGNRVDERLARDDNLRLVRVLGMKAWKRVSGYHMRSLAETAMYRFKQLLGDKLMARGFESQCAEAFAKCAALNIMTQQGMPDGHMVYKI